MMKKGPLQQQQRVFSVSCDFYFHPIWIFEKNRVIIRSTRIGVLFLIEDFHALLLQFQRETINKIFASPMKSQVIEACSASMVRDVQKSFFCLYKHQVGMSQEIADALRPDLIFFIA